MKNLTIRRMTERGDNLRFAAMIEQRRTILMRTPYLLWGGRLWRLGAPVRTPALDRYVRYLRYRRNIKRLGIS